MREEPGRAELVPADGLVEGVQVGEAEAAGRAEGGAVVFQVTQPPAGVPVLTVPVRAVGVLVNGLRKPMENSLSHGQVVDLITGPYADPPDSWLAAAHSGQARAHLKAAVVRRKAEEAAALGRAAVAKALLAMDGQGGDAGRQLRDLEDDGTAFSAARRLGFPDLDVLYEAVGRERLSAAGFVTHLGIEVRGA